MSQENATNGTGDENTTTNENQDVNTTSDQNSEKETSETETTEKGEEKTGGDEAETKAENTSDISKESPEEPKVDEDAIAKQIDTFLIEKYRTSAEKKTPEALCKFLSETYGVKCVTDNKSPHYVKILVGEKRIVVPFQNDQLVSVIVSSSASEAGRVEEQERINQMDPLEVFAERIAVIIEERRNFIRPLFTKAELSEVIQRTPGHPEFEFEDKKPAPLKKGEVVKTSSEGETAIIFKSGEGESAKQCRLPGEGYFKYQK